MTLNFGQANETYRVEALDLPPKVAKRLEALGMVRETEVEVMRVKPRGAMIVKCAARALPSARAFLPISI